MRYLTPVLVFASVFWSTPAATAAEHTKDSLKTVQEGLQADKAQLVDVREQSEWDEGHLQQAKLLPLSRLRKGVPADELTKLLSKDKVIYLHCRSGGRCLEAADRLKQAGYDVRPLKPGYPQLLEAGFPKASE